MALQIQYPSQMQNNQIFNSLQAMGYAEQYIHRAVQVHNRTKMGTNYDLCLLVEIITRLKSKDQNRHNQPQNITFKPHFSKQEALKLNVNDSVDFRFENGRFVLCKIIEKSINNFQQPVVLLHPLGVPLSNTKHNRYCNLYSEYFQLASAKSISLRKIISPTNPLSKLRVDDYVDIYGAENGWVHGRIVKIDADSSQIKVFYHNKIHKKYRSYWVHIENSAEIAVFSSKCKETEDSKSDKSDDEEMYAQPTTSTIGGEFIPVHNNNYKTISVYPIDQYSHFSTNSLMSINSEAYTNVHTNEHRFSYPKSSISYKESDAIVTQLTKFGYGKNEVVDAIDNVSNPSDINEVVEYISGNNIVQIPLPQSPLKQQEDIHEEEEKMMTTPMGPSHKELNSIEKICVFGIDPISLKATMVSDKDYGVPIPDVLIKLKYELLNNNGHLVENLFQNNNTETFIQMFDRINCGNISDVDFNSQTDAKVIVNLIMEWFKRLPKPLLSDVSFDTIKQCKNMRSAGELIENEIGEPNESYFKWLLDLCIDLYMYEAINKMSVKNISVVVAPYLYNSTEIVVCPQTIKFIQLCILWRHFKK